ncbi:MAG TPA: two-component regulator propeller domain-containing protein [Bacteroidales bacterium]|nr:two-component regulator propeller domain-containing protein [Bacteroidales bacterium]
MKKLFFVFFALSAFGLTAQNFSITNYTTSNSPIGSNSITALKGDSNGNMWIGSSDNGLTVLSSSTGTILTTSDGLVGNNVKDIDIDGLGNVWIATTAGLSKYNGSTFTNYTTAQGLPSNDLRCVFVDASNNVWIGTSAGVCKYDGSFTTYTTTDGLIHNTVLAITQDLSGNMWFGTAEGVNKLAGTIWTDHTFLNGVNANGDQVQSATTDADGNIWVGSLPSMGLGGGLYKWDGTSWTTYTTTNGLAHNDVRGIASDPMSRIWIATNGNGTSHFRNATFTTYGTSTGIISTSQTCSEVDYNGFVWIGTNAGISRISTLVIQTSITTNAHCGNDDGSLTINVGTINGPVYFTYDNGVTITTNNTLNNLTAGVYQVQFTDSSIFASMAIEIFSSTQAMDAITETTYNLCDGDSMLPGVDPAFTNCLWDPASVVSDANIPNPLISPTTNMWVSLTYTDTNGCAGEDSIQFFIMPVPTVFVNITNDSVFTSPLIFNNYQWFLYGDTIPAATGQSYTATQPGVYMLCANNTGQCVGCSDPINFQNAGFDENNDWAKIFANDGILHWMLPSEECMISIYAPDGRLLQQFIAPDKNGTLTLKNNVSGIILIQVENGDRSAWIKAFAK